MASMESFLDFRCCCGPRRVVWSKERRVSRYVGSLEDDTKRVLSRQIYAKFFAVVLRHVPGLFCCFTDVSESSGPVARRISQILGTIWGELFADRCFRMQNCRDKLEASNASGKGPSCYGHMPLLLPCLGDSRGSLSPSVAMPSIAWNIEFSTRLWGWGLCFRVGMRCNHQARRSQALRIAGFRVRFDALQPSTLVQVSSTIIVVYFGCNSCS